MRKLALLALPIALLLTASPAFAKDWSIESFKKQARESEWEGFGVGTSVTSKTSMTSPMGKRENEERKTIVAVDDTDFTIKVEKKQADGTWKETRTDKEARTKGVTFKMTDKGTAKIKVGETEYDCKIVSGTKTEDGKDETMKFWVNDKHGILQMEMPGGPGGSITMTVSKLDYEKTIGDVTLKGVRTFKATMTGGSMTMEVAVSSPEPMLVQKMEMDQGGAKMSRSGNVTALTIKKPKAAAVVTK